MDGSEARAIGESLQIGRYAMVRWWVICYALGLFQIVVGILGLIAFGWSAIGILRPRELPQMAFHGYATRAIRIAARRCRA